MQVGNEVIIVDYDIIASLIHSRIPDHVHYIVGP